MLRFTIICERNFKNIQKNAQSNKQGFWFSSLNLDNIKYLQRMDKHEVISIPIKFQFDAKRKKLWK